MHTIDHFKSIHSNQYIQNGNRFTDQAPRKGFRPNGRKFQKPRNRRLQLLKLANKYKEEHNPVFGGH